MARMAAASDPASRRSGYAAGDMALGIRNV